MLLLCFFVLFFFLLLLQLTVPDQNAPEGIVCSGSTLFCPSIEYFKKQLHKKQNLGQKGLDKVFDILEYLS